MLDDANDNNAKAVQLGASRCSHAELVRRSRLFGGEGKERKGENAGEGSGGEGERTRSAVMRCEATTEGMRDVEIWGRFGTGRIQHPSDQANPRAVSVVAPTPGNPGFQAGSSDGRGSGR